MPICPVSLPSELIFVLTPQQDFHSILSHCKWVCTHLLLSHTHTLRCPHSKAPGIEEDRWWCLHLLTCTLSLGHLPLQFPAAEWDITNSPWNKIWKMSMALCTSCNEKSLKRTHTYERAILNKRLKVRWRFTLKCCWTLSGFHCVGWAVIAAGECSLQVHLVNRTTVRRIHNENTRSGE